MKKAIVLLLFLPLLLSTASAAGLGGLISGAGALPDPADLLGGNAFLYEEDVIDGGIVYVAFTFPMPKDYEDFLSEYADIAKASGYDVSSGRIMDMDAQRVSSGAKAAWLVPDYRGALLFLVNASMDYAPIPTPTPTPQPTPKPTTKPQNTGGRDVPTIPSGGGHVEYIEVKQDCFACVGGTCDLCSGSGWYRLYGESVPCPILCQTCKGLGYWYTTQPVWVP